MGREDKVVGARVSFCWLLNWEILRQGLQIYMQILLVNSIFQCPVLKARTPEA